MLTNLSLERFQGFSTRTQVPIKPLTLIFGPNSSGKSSLIRSLLLSKQSLGGDSPYSSRRIGFEYEGEATSLASFANVVYKHDEKSTFVVELALSCGPNRKMAEARRMLREREYGLGSYVMVDLESSVEKITSSWEVSKEKPVANCKISVKFIEQAAPLEIEFKLENSEISNDKISINYGFTIKNLEIFLNLIESRVPSADKAFIQDEYVLADVREVIPGNDEAEHGSFRSKFREEIENIDHLMEDLVFDVIDNFVRITPASARESIFGQNLSQLLSYQQAVVKRHLRGVKHIGPLREISQRLTYAAGSILALDEDSSEVQATPVENEVSNWLYELTDGRYRLSPIESYLGQARFLGALKSKILTDTKTGTPVTFQDVGVGLSQVLPILELISGAAPKREHTLLIEQPELHLHPKMQANLVDLFIKFIQNDPMERCIISETHSEAMLLRVQKRIREGSLDPSLVQIIYVDQTPESPESNRGEGNFAFALPIDENGDFIMPMPNSFSSLRFEDLI